MNEDTQFTGVIMEEDDGTNWKKFAVEMEDLSDEQMDQAAGGYGSDIDPVAY